MAKGTTDDVALLPLFGLLEVTFDALCVCLYLYTPPKLSSQARATLDDLPGC